MLAHTAANPTHFPLTLRDDLSVQSISEIAEVVVAESDAQVANKAEEVAGIDEWDFSLSCDALNFWRMKWRLEQEWGSILADAYHVELVGSICEMRHYDEEEFELALQATKERVRMPFGLQPLDVAFRKMEREPIRLLAAR